MEKDRAIKDIIEQCRQGKSAAQEKLYKKYYGLMLSVCLRYTKSYDDAVEVLNSGYLKVFQNLDKYKGDGEYIVNWIKTIMINTAIDKIRFEKNRIYDALPLNTNDNSHYIQNDAVSNLGEEELLALVQQVPPTSRMVFNLYVFEGYNHRDIAEKLNITESTSQWHLLNARRILIKKITELNHRESVING